MTDHGHLDDNPGALDDDVRPDQDCGQAGPHGCQFCAACLDWGDALAAAEYE